jgi:hypothetical protein
MANYENTRFYDFNFVENAYGGVNSVSSGTFSMEYASDGLSYTRWASATDGKDGSTSWWAQSWGISARELDTVIVIDTNIKDLTILVDDDDGSPITVPTNLVTQKSADGKNYRFTFQNGNYNGIKLIGSSTVTANAQKYIGNVIATNELGQFEHPVRFRGSMVKEQVSITLESGKKFVIDKGDALSGMLVFKSHTSTHDMELFCTLLDRGSEFHIWPNGGNESQFRYPFYPFRFKDVFKVAIVGKSLPEYTANYFKAGLNATLNVEEVQ